MSEKSVLSDMQTPEVEGTTILRNVAYGWCSDAAP